MTPEQQAIMFAIGDALRAQPMSWNQIPEDTKQTVIALMQPAATGFTPEQATFLNWWWMKVDAVRLAQINSSLPPHTVCEPRIDDVGDGFISADLFSDAVLPDSRLEPILPQLLDLTLQYLPPSYWPVVPINPPPIEQ